MMNSVIDDLLGGNAAFTMGLLDTLPTPVFATDHAGQLVVGNRAFAHLLGCADLLRPGVLLSGVPGTVAQRLAAEQEQGWCALAQGTPLASEEVLLETTEGPKHPYLLTQAPVTGFAEDNSAVLVGVLTDLGEQKELKALSSELELILSAAGEGIFGLDPEGLITFVNPKASSLLDYPPQELLGQHALPLIQPHDVNGMPLKVADSTIARAYNEGRAGSANDEVFVKRGRQVMPVKYIVTPIEAASALDGAVVVFSDITESLQQEQELKRIRAALDDSSDAVVVTDVGGTILYINMTYGNLFGLTVDHMTGFDAANAHVVAAEFPRLFRAVKNGESVSCDVELSPKMGKSFPARVRGTAILDNDFDIIGALFLYTDITEQKRLEHELHLLTRQDGLTGIANRRAFDNALENEWRRARREKAALSLFMIDIDAFKRYNDYYGHQEGDDCLQKVAKALSDGFQRPGDFVARYGGEEFAIIVANGGADGPAQQGESLRAAIEALKIPHAFSQTSEFVTISMGLATLVSDGSRGPEHLIRAADHALYTAKKSGRNQLCIADAAAPEP